MNKVIKAFEEISAEFRDRRVILYEDRTRIERALFNFVNKITLSNFQFKVGGFSTTHRNELESKLESLKPSEEILQAIEKIFSVYDLTIAVTASDPYLRAENFQHLDKTEGMNAWLPELIEELEELIQRAMKLK